MIKEKKRLFNRPVKVLFLLVIVLGLSIILIFVFNNNDKLKVIDTIVLENGNEIKIASDGTKFIVDPSKIDSGGPSKGGIGVDVGIPALSEENINFVSVDEADKWIEDDELVLVLQYKGVERVYPLQIMTYHEIANDVVANDPILVTYSPLSGSGIAYERKVDIESDEKITRFGTSGKLYNSNLVMYDEFTESYWSQINGKVIVGELAGQELKEISVDIVIWKDWINEHKDSEVLSQDTGFIRSYGEDNYANYFKDDFLIFDVENKDNRIKNKDVVFGVEIDNKFKAYREEDLIEKEIIEDVIGNVDVRIERSKDGIVKVTRLDTSGEVVKERDFWFAWFAFHPDTELYGF